MAIIRWRHGSVPFRPMREMEQGIERIRGDLDRIFHDFGMRTRSDPMGVFPPLNVTEDEAGIVVHAELPGVSPEDLDISVEGDTLTLKGTRRPGDTTGSISYHRREREHGRFRRSVTLPVPIELDQVVAQCRHGILQIVLPKAKAASPQKIAIKSSE